MESCKVEMPAVSPALTADRFREVAVGEETIRLLRKPLPQSADHSDIPSTASPILQIAEVSSFAGSCLASIPSTGVTVPGCSFSCEHSAGESRTLMASTGRT